MKTLHPFVTKRRVLALLLMTALLLVIALPVFAGELMLTTTLTGAAERPGPGDPDGSGSATIFINRVPRAVCFEIHVEDIEPATLAHIHVGGPDVPGPIVVHLTPPDENGDSSGCVEDVPASIIKNLRSNARQYYVNVHNAEYPAGAVRGQLFKER